MADDTKFIQDLIDAALLDTDGRGDPVIRIPGGAYDFTSLTIDLSKIVSLTEGARITILGDGSGVTQLNCISTDANNAGILITNTNWTDGRMQARLTLKGVYLYGAQPLLTVGGTAIAVSRAIAVIFEDIFIVQWYQAMDLTDVVQIKFLACHFEWNNRGIIGQAGAEHAQNGTGSPPNEIIFVGCHWNANRQYCLWLTQGTNIVFTGGSMEGTGLFGSGSRWGIRITNGGHNGSNILGIYGLHFEETIGAASIWIEHGASPGVYNIDADFVRNGASFDTNNILFETTGASQAKVNSRSGHWSVNNYVPDAGRPYIGFGSVTGALHTIEVGGSMFFSATEIPTGVNVYGVPI